MILPSEAAAPTEPRRVRDALKAKGDKCVVAKKGAKYVGWKAGELALVVGAADALAFSSVASAQHFIDRVTIDDRNAELIGRRFSVCPLTRG